MDDRSAASTPQSNSKAKRAGNVPGRIQRHIPYLVVRDHNAGTIGPEPDARAALLFCQHRIE